eukprot:m.1481493 g.1481493  ORF g.1481493 m.1481493 type:complete len:1109 (+) comp25177_c1_seq6:260-3586(+)
MASSAVTAESIPFADLVYLFESNNKSRKQRLVSFIRHFRTSCKDSFFPVMRLLLPQWDRDRTAYSLKEAALARLYVEALDVSTTSIAAEKLVNWQDSTYNGNNTGNFSKVVRDVLLTRAGGNGRITVGEVNTALDTLAALGKSRFRRKSVNPLKQTVDSLTQSEKKALKLKTIRQLIYKTTPDEHMWIVRLITRELKCGLTEGSVLAAFHPDAKALHETCSSIEKVCTDLRDASTRLSKISIKLMQPFRPMLAIGMLKTTKAILNELGQKCPSFYVETKIDGERAQLHTDCSHEYKYFTRNSFDTSNSYQRHWDKIRPLFKPNVNSCILDGEMVNYDPARKVFVTKGEGGMDVKNHGNARGDDNTDIAVAPAPNTDETTAHRGSPFELQPCLIVFDILYFNGEVLTEYPLTKRLELLRDTFTELEGWLVVAKPKLCCSQQELEQEMIKSVDDLEEGIMVKPALSTYAPGNRKSWIKWKPEYNDSLCDTMDLVVIGGYFGIGERGGGRFSHFLLAAPEIDSHSITEDEMERADGPRIVGWHPVCKVGTGYSRQEIQDLNDRFKALWVHNKKEPKRLFERRAPFLKHVHENVDRPDAWIDPMVSIVFEVKAAELQPSTDFKCGFTLRFPRVKCFRHDKGPADATTLQNIRELQQLRKGKMTGALRQRSGSTQDSLTSVSQDDSSLFSMSSSQSGLRSGMKRRRISRCHVGQGLAPHLALVAQCAKMVPTTKILHGYLLKFCFPAESFDKELTEKVHQLASTNENVLGAIFPADNASSSSASLTTPVASSVAASASLGSLGSQPALLGVDRRIARLARMPAHHILAALARDFGAEITSVLPQPRATIAGNKRFDPDRYTAVTVVANKLQDVAKQVVDRDYPIDIVKPEWLVACLEITKRLPVLREYALRYSDKTNALLSQYIDKFGDTYAEDTTPEALQSLFDRNETAVLAEEQEHCGTEVAHTVADNLQDLAARRPFLGLHLCVQHYEYTSQDCVSPPCGMNTPLFLAAMTAQRLGARISWWRIETTCAVQDCIRRDATHVVYDPLRCSASELRAIQQLNADRVLQASADDNGAGGATSFRVVPLAWVTTCVQAKKLVEEKHHVVQGIST